MEYLESVSAGCRDFFFDDDDTPLPLVDGSRDRFRRRPGDLEDLLREIDRTVTGSHSYVARKS